MPSKARRYSHAESLTLSTTTTASDQTKVTLTFTPDANSNYVYIWNADIQATSGTTYDNIVTLKNNAGTALSATNWEARDTTDFATISGLAFETFGASPTSQSITLTYRTESAGNSVGIRNARIVAIKLTSADQYVENTADSSTTSTSLQTATTLTFTPATTGTYLILGSAEMRSSGASVTVNSQITYSATGYNVAATRVNDTTNYISGLMQASVGSLTATSKTITLQYSASSVNTVNCRRARLLALRLDEFTTSDITTDSTSTSTTSLTYATKTTTGAVSITEGLDYLVIGTATLGISTGSPTTISSGYGLSVASTYSSESLVESPSAGYYASANFGSFKVITGGSAGGSAITTQFNYYSETASVTTVADDVTLSVLLLDPTDLYWVGGGGTWDSSTNTDWAVTSGGTGGAAAPKSGTNVYFDASSDSGAPFTVTIGTGAVCKNMLVSGLDQTMTWSGSAAMSVYGNFTVPATNFTQSYTGTITFTAPSSTLGNQLITTNGKTFTSATFVGISQDWTLQDAFTVTGTVTLTSGEIVLQSYTLTCNTFDSNNSNTRAINFGTGKIVITSSSTATVWDTATITGFSTTGTQLVELTGGGATTKTVSTGALSETNSISFSFLNTAGTVRFTSGNGVRNVFIANNSITYEPVPLTVYGDFTINGSTPTVTAGASTMTFAATSGTKVITTNGVTLDIPITFDGAGGTWRLGSALTVGTSTSRTISHLTGTVDLYGYDITLFGIYSITGTNTRALNNTGGTTNAIILSLNTATTVWSGATLSNFTTDGNINVKLTGSGATTKTVTHGTTGGNENNAISVEVTSTFAGTVSISIYVRNLTFANASYTIANTTMTIYGNVTFAGSSPTLTAGTLVWTFGATSGTKTITSGGEVFDFPVTFNGTGGTWQLQDALAIGTSTSRTLTFTAGTIDLNEFNITLFGQFSSSNSNTRTLDFGSASKIILTASGTTVWSSATATNFEVLGTNPLVQATGTGATVTMSFGAHSESGSVNVQLSCATITTVVVTGSIRDLIIDNNDITLSNGVRTIYGNLTVSGTTPTLSSGTSVTTFAATSGTKTINLNGNASNTLDFPITFNGAGGTWQLQHSLNIGTATSRTVTLTAGTIDLNNYDLTIYGIFASSNANNRTLAFGSSGRIILSLAGATSTTIWQCATATNLTVTGTSEVRVTGSGTLVRTIQAGSTVIAGENGALNFNLVASAGSITLTNESEFNNLTINASGAIVNFNSHTIYGNLETLSTPTTGGGDVVTFAGNSGVKTINTGGVTYVGLTVNKGTGGELRLANNLTLSASFSVNSGTFSANNYNVLLQGSTNSFLSNTFNVRTVNFGQNDWILSGSSSEWKIQNANNLTLNVTSNIIFTANTGTNRNINFYGGDKTYNAVIFNGNNSSTTGSINVYGNNTFDAFLQFSPLNINFQSNSYNYFNNVHFGTFSARPNIYSTTQTIRANLVYTGNTLVKKLRFDSFDVRDIAASPSDFWYFGGLSVDDGNNSNVYFTNPPLYWYNGSGVWNESSTSNWSYFTGGGVAGSAGYYPDQYTDVYFDANSDVGTSYSVTTSNNINVKYFNVFDQQYPLNMQISSTTLMNVYADYYTTNVNFTFSGNSTTSGTIQFPQSANIITNGTVAKCAFSFDGASTFNFNDNFTTESNVSITRATAFNFNNNTIKTSDFGIKGTSTKNIYFGDSGILQLQNDYGDAYIRMDVNQGTVGTSLYGNKLVEIVGADNIYINNTEINLEANAFSYNVKAGNTIYLAGEAKDLNFSGFNGTWASNNFIISGNLILSNTMTIAGTGTHTLTFDGDLRALPQYFTCNGQSLPYNIDLVAVNNYGYELLDTFRTSANTLFDLDSSTLNLSNYDLEINGTFYSVGSPVRGLLTNGGRIKITTNGLNAINGTTVFDTSTPTNLSNPNNVIVELYGNTSANVNVTRFASVGFMDEANTFNIIVNQAGGTFAFGTPNSVKSLTLKSNTSTYDFSSTSRQMTIYKDLTIESGITHTGGTGVLTFAGTGSNSQTITTNGFVIDKPITLGGTARYILGDAFTLGTTRTLTFNSGTLDVNGYTMTVNTMVIPDNSTRLIDHGSNGTIVITGSGMSFNANGRNISYEGLGTINMTAGAAKIFTANGNSFATLNQGGTGKLTVSNGGIFYNMTSTVANTFVEFYYLDRYTFTNDFQVSGANNSHRITLISNTHPIKGFTPGGPNNARLTYTGNSVINVEYMLIRADDFGVSPNNTWFVRRSPKTTIAAQSYNDESANSIVSLGFPVGTGWVFIRENNFFPFFI